MQDITMGIVETKFADIIWQNEPISSTEIWKEAELLLGWKKSTTFTVLKRLCSKGIFQNEKGTVTSLISKSEFVSLQSEKFIEETFEGSLPAFLTAFTKRKTMTAKEIQELKKIVNQIEED